MIFWVFFLKILDPISALIVVDVQNDFITGTLPMKTAAAKQDGEVVVPIINRMIDECHFDMVVYSVDWHPKSHISFIQNVGMREIHHTSKVSIRRNIQST